MWIAVQLAYHHHSPETIKEGMLFMNHIKPNTEKEIIEVWEIDKKIIELLEYNDIIKLYGYPVLPYLIDEDQNVVTIPDEIGWWDAGDVTDELINITIQELNFIMREFDGLLELLVDEDELEQGYIEPILENELVIMRFLKEED
jgi:hypothetical protein